MKFKGEVTYLGDVESVGKSETPRQTISVEGLDGKYREGYVFSCWGQVIDSISMQNIQETDEVEVEFDGKVSVWERDGKTRRFNNLSVRSIKKTRSVSDDKVF